MLKSNKNDTLNVTNVTKKERLMMYQKYIPLLIKTPLFQGSETHEVEGLVLCLNPIIRKYIKSELVTLEGHSISSIGLVLEGTLMITRDIIDGSRIVMKKVGPGEMFGEIAAFSDSKIWPATVIAQEDAVVMFMPSDKIVGICPTGCIGHKKLMSNMLRIISNKAIQLNEKIGYLSVKSIREKIAKYLIDQYRIQQQKTLYLNMNRNEMAEYLNVTRPSLSREMASMKEEGLIDYYRSSVKLLDIPKLTHYLQ